MKIYKFTIIVLLVLSTSIFSFAQWTKTNYQNPDLTRTLSRKIIAVQDKLFLISDDVVFSSKDNGQTWINESLNLPENQFLNTISFAGGYLYVAYTNSLTTNKDIFKKTLSGQTWERMTIALSSPDDNIDIISGNKDTIILSTTKGLIYYSPDQGKTFSPSILSSSPSRNYDILVVGSTVFLGRSTTLLKSKNMGASFEVVRNVDPTINIEHDNEKTYFVTNRGVFVSNDLGVNRIPLVTTTDSGFPLLTTSDLQTLFNSEFRVVNDTFYLALNFFTLSGNKDGVFVSTNQGKTWKPIWKQVHSYFGSTCFEVLNGNMLVGTVFAGIYKSSDFGLTWNQSSKGMVSNYTRLSSSMSNEIVAYANENSISDNEGDTWINFPMEMGLYYGKFLNKHFAITKSKEFMTSTNGRDWQKEKMGIPDLSQNTPYPKLCFDNGKLYLIADKILYLYNTLNNKFSKLYAYNTSNFTPELKNIEHISNSIILVSAYRKSSSRFFTYGYNSYANPNTMCWIENTDSLRNLLSTFFYSRDNGNTWNRPSGLPQNLADAKVYSDEHIILITGKLKVTEFSTDVISPSFGLSAEIITKGISTFYISRDNGLNFQKIELSDLISGVDYGYYNYFYTTKDDFNVFKPVSFDLLNPYKTIGYYFTTDFISWKKDSSINVAGLNNLINHKETYYLATFQDGLLESKDQGKTWIKNSSFEAPNAKLAIVNNLLVCYTGNSLYYQTSNKWEKITSDNLPSSITNVGATADNIFVTTRRDGIWKHKMDFPVSVEERNEKTQLSIYPNPATEQISILSNQSINKYSLFDISGRLLLEQKVEDTNEVYIDISSIQSGIYVLKIRSQNQTTSTTISIIK